MKNNSRALVLALIFQILTGIVLLFLFLGRPAKAEGKVGGLVLPQFDVKPGYRVWGSIDEKWNFPLGLAVYGQHENSLDTLNSYLRGGTYIRSDKTRLDVFLETKRWSNHTSTVNFTGAGFGIEQKLW